MHVKNVLSNRFDIGLGLGIGLRLHKKSVHETITLVQNESHQFNCDACEKCFVKSIASDFTRNLFMKK